MTQFILGLMLSHDGRGISTTNDDDRTFLSRFDVGVEEACGACCECRKFKDTRRTTYYEQSINDYEHCVEDTNPFQRMVFASKTVVRNKARLLGPTSSPNQASGIPSASVAVLVYSSSVLVNCDRYGGIADLCILVELICNNIINGEDELHVVLLGLLDEPCYLFGPRFVEKRAADLH